MKNKNFIILYGGISSEHNISIRSFEYIYDLLKINKYLAKKLKGIVYLDKDEKYYFYSFEESKSSNYYRNKKTSIELTDILSRIKEEDIYLFSLLYGKYGEDGAMQGLVEVLRIKSNFGTIFSNAISINKYHMYHYFSNEVLFNLPKTILIKQKEDITDALKYFKNKTCIIKPNSLGSSLYIEKIIDPREINIINICNVIFEKSDDVLIQEYINGVEYTCACSDYSGIVKILPLVKVINLDTIFDYKTKYIDCISHYEIVEDTTKVEYKIQKITKYIYNKLEAKHTIRVDFIVKKDKIYVLEINTLPGLSEKSSLSLMLASEDISVDKYIERLIEI